MPEQRKKLEDLRSARWLGQNDLRSFSVRSRALQMGYTRVDFAGKPVIAIVNTWSDINQCHLHFKMRVEEVKRGIWQAGGFPTRNAGEHALRTIPEAVRYALPQYARDGNRRAVALVSVRRSCANGWLR